MRGKTNTIGHSLRRRRRGHCAGPGRLYYYIMICGNRTTAGDDRPAAAAVRGVPSPRAIITRSCARARVLLTRSPTVNYSSRTRRRRRRRRPVQYMKYTRKYVHGGGGGDLNDVYICVLYALYNTRTRESAQNRIKILPPSSPARSDILYRMSQDDLTMMSDDFCSIWYI